MTMRFLIAYMSLVRACADLPESGCELEDRSVEAACLVPLVKDDRQSCHLPRLAEGAGRSAPTDKRVAQSLRY